jgi:hypothetical protein
VAPRDVRLSTESPEAAEAGHVARRGAQQAPPVDPVACSIAGRLEACPAGAPSAPHDSGGTTRGAGRAHSSEWRTGSTPGSPDQRSAGDGAGHWDASRRARVAESVQSQLSCGDGAGCRQLASGAEPARPSTDLRGLKRGAQAIADSANSYLWLSTVSTGLSTAGGWVRERINTASIG